MFFDGGYFCMQNHSWLCLPVTHPVATQSLSSALEKQQAWAKSEVAPFGNTKPYFHISNSKLRQWVKTGIQEETVWHHFFRNMGLWDNKPVFNRSTKVFAAFLPLLLPVWNSESCQVIIHCWWTELRSWSGSEGRFFLPLISILRISPLLPRIICAY